MKILIDLLVAAAFGVILAIVLAEWAAGCGESYIDSEGIRHQNECLFVRR